MIISSSEILRATSHEPPASGLAIADGATHWYPAQTRARHEKRIAEQLLSKGIDSYLPLYEKMSRWKDRRVRVQLPLFDGYVFVRFAWRDRLRALEIPGIARFVSFGGYPVAVPDPEIESIRASLKSGLGVNPVPYLALGQRIRIRSGPLEGCEGYLVRRKGACRLILSVTLIQRSIAVEVDAREV